ncbi:MAG: T9SS type A sorting domain-containing protein [Chloroherpetonaceae bacterium]|nr:T9SS type A sorting domain-containing protein [Chloroherpetonaceae bacterium]
MRKAILLFWLLILSTAAYSQVNINSLPATITQDFNTLATSGTTNTWTDNSTLTGWYATWVGGTGTFSNQYRADDGSSNTGALYSFGTGTQTDRALGSLASGTTGTIIFGIRLKNNTAQTITSLQISYTGEQWRNGGRTDNDSLHFSYQIGATVTSLTSGTWTADTDLSFVGPVNAATASALNGNLAANRVTRTKTLTVSIPAGQEIMLRWVDFNSPGNDHGLAVDDLTITASATAAGPATQLAFVNVPANGIVNTNLPAFTVEARDANNALVTSFAGNITLAKASGPGNLSGTLTKAAVAGVATFDDIKFDQAGTYTLTATSGSLTAATSGNINITAPTPTKLAITSITPASPTAGQPFSVTVQAQDAANQPANVTQATGVQLSATGSTIGGTTTGTIPAGQNSVIISGVTLSPAATNVTLTATRTSGDNLAAGTSAPFTVQAGFSPFYEPFNGTGALNAAPNWATHSGTAGQIQFLTTPSDVGNSLSYPQLAPPQGNRVRTTRNNTEDVNRAFPAVASGVLYYSALIKFLDTLGLADNTSPIGDYPLHLATTSGSTGVTVFFARLHIRKGTSGNTVQIGVANRGAAGSTNPTFNTANFPVGQTHFVVIKYDFASGVASLWINPTTNFGGSEPAGAVTNNASTDAIAQAASICIRQGSNTGNIEIDEIRVGQTWASVTPAAPPATQLAFTSVPTAGTAGVVLPPIVVQARRADNTVATDFTGNITLSRATGPGTIGGTLTRAAVNGTATFNDITLSQAGTYTLSASATGLTSATSSNITILARASQLAFVNVPTSGRVGQFLPAFRVQARRPDNTVDTSFRAVITIGRQSSAALPEEVDLQTLSGVLSKAAVNGEATFDSVRVDVAGPVTLTASAQGLPTASSPVINIAPPPATRLRFVNAPTSARQNIVIPTFFVDAVRADTTRDTTFTGNITVSLIGTGTLTGNTTRAAVQGRATFDSLRITAAGNFRLVATSGTLIADTTATFGVLSVERDISAGVPRDFALWQNYPNPFNPSTVIVYELPAVSDVVLKVYDMLGREVATLISQRQTAGRYRVTFNAQNLASGIYLYRLQAGRFVETKKMILLK